MDECVPETAPKRPARVIIAASNEQKGQADVSTEIAVMMFVKAQEVPRI